MATDEEAGPVAMVEEAQRARGERLKGPRVAPSAFGPEGRRGRRGLILQVGGQGFCDWCFGADAFAHTHILSFSLIHI